MLFLGIESSCDETAAAVLRAENGHLFALSNVVASQVDTHRLYGGVVPEIASRAHTEAISRVVYEALSEAGVAPRDLCAVGVTAGPGLIGALLVGVNFAKGFAAAHDLPLVPVDHIRAHMAAASVEGIGENGPPHTPFLALVVSGGHTALYRVDEGRTFHPLCGTRDDAMGESFDKIGRMIGIPYPAGAGFDRLATEGFCAAVPDTAIEEAYRRFPRSEIGRSPDYALPSPALSDGSGDFSFSGLKTAAINLLHRAEARGQAIDRAALAAAYTHRAVEAVATRMAAMLRDHPGHDLVVAGGVAANSHLRRRLADTTQAAGVRLHMPPLSLCGDNGVMVAAETYYAYLAGVRAGDDLNASAADNI